MSIICHYSLQPLNEVLRQDRGKVDVGKDPTQHIGNRDDEPRHRGRAYRFLHVLHEDLHGDLLDE